MHQVSAGICITPCGDNPDLHGLGSIKALASGTVLSCSPASTPSDACVLQQQEIVAALQARPVACMSRIFLCALLTHVLLLSISETRGSKAKPHHEPAAIPVHASHMGWAL